VRDLNSTSYALLSLLAVQPFSTYELAQQMERSLDDFWRRAQSVLYDEPKNLVAHGLATSGRTYTGRRPTTTYRITPKGRRALRRWLDQPATGVRLEFEALLPVAFADHGSPDQLRQRLRAIRDDAERNRQRTRQRGEEYLHTGGPFPDRLPVIALVAKFLIEHAALVARWAAWAEDVVADWPGSTIADGAKVPTDAFQATWNGTDQVGP
jgi:PadR family transcriptional regulator AphA